MREALERLDTHQVAAAAAACVRAERAAGCQLLELAALWADHHPANGILHQHTDLAIAGEESAQFGGDGTPEVAEFAPAELGLEIGMNPYQTRSLVADALDLRHRFPRLWARVQAGDVPAKDARQVAYRTRLLSREQALVVDRRIARVIGQLSWTRLDNLLQAESQRVDAERIQQQTESAKRFRGVQVGRGSEHGLTEVWMQLDTNTALRMKAQLARLAEVMMTHPDQLPVGVQVLGARSKHEWEAVAAGLDPATALQVLTLADQPDLFLDLEPFLRAAGARLGEPPEVMPDPPAVSAAPRPDRPDPDPSDTDQLRTGAPVADPPVVDSAVPAEPRTATPGTVPTADPAEPAPEDADPSEPNFTAQDLADWDLPEPVDDPSRADPITAGPAAAAPPLPEPHPEPDPEPGPTPAELREAVMKDLARRIDPDKLLPTVILHVHISAETLRPYNRGEDPGVARVEGIGPVLLSTVREWLGAGCRIRVLPVLDPAGIRAVDAYEVPDRMTEAVLTRSPASVFPWSAILNRHRLDLDHTVPYTGPPGSPPGQTRPENLGPLGRSEHRFKTFGRVRVRQPDAGTFLWRTRFGRVIVTNPAGTHNLGTGAFADAVWHSATHGIRSQVA